MVIHASSLERAFRNLVLGTVVLFLMVVLLGVYVYIVSENSRQDIAAVAENSNNALCSLRADLERRVEVSQDFLRENPDGIPGISAEVIRTGILNQQRTINALSGLDCEAVP